MDDKIIWVDPLTLKPHPKNSNKHPEEQIVRLSNIIKYQGWRQPIVVSKRSDFIVAGHGRLEAAKKLGLTKVPVSIQHFDDETQELAHMVADNAIALWAELDVEAIKEQIPDFSEGFDLDLLGLESLDDLLPKEDLYADKDADEIPEKVEPKAKIGQIYKLGEHRLMCGDSTSSETVGKLMAGEKADMVFTDPPYGVGYKYNSHNDNVTQEEHRKFSKWLIKFGLENGKRFIITPGCNNLEMYCQESEPTHIGCWTKTNAMSPGRVTHFWTWEPIFFYGKWKRKRGNDVFNFPVGKQPDTGDHTCPKPLNLWVDIIENFSNAEETILDIFGGSGSTLIACEKTNRKCFMMELDPHYVDVIIARWEQFTGKKAELIDG